MTNGTISLQFNTPEEANTALASLAPDNDGHLEATVDGTTLHLSASSKSIMGLLRTMDDALSCLRATGIE